MFKYELQDERRARLQAEMDLREEERRHQRAAVDRDEARRDLEDARTRLNAICQDMRDAETARDEARAALRKIAYLYPLPDDGVPIVREVPGAYDGKSRGIRLAAALDIARTALGLATEPQQEG